MSRRRLDLEEVREIMYARQNKLCAYCGDSLEYDQAQLAHRIPEALWAIKKYGMSVIDHPLNKAMTHPGRCNDGMMIAAHDVECERLVKEIRIAFAKGTWW